MTLTKTSRRHRRGGRDGGGAGGSRRRRPCCAGATMLPPTHPQVQMIERIATEVKEKTGGRIDIQTFPAGQLGSRGHDRIGRHRRARR